MHAQPKPKRSHYIHKYVCIKCFIMNNLGGKRWKNIICSQWWNIMRFQPDQSFWFWPFGIVSIWNSATSWIGTHRTTLNALLFIWKSTETTTNNNNAKKIKYNHVTWGKTRSLRVEPLDAPTVQEVFHCDTIESPAMDDQLLYSLMLMAHHVQLLHLTDALQYAVAVVLQRTKGNG